MKDRGEDEMSKIYDVENFHAEKSSNMVVATWKQIFSLGFVRQNSLRHDCSLRFEDR